MLEGDKQTSEMGGSTRATSVEYKIGPVTLPSSHHKETGKNARLLEYLYYRIYTQDTVLPQRPCGRVVSEEYHRAAAVAGPPSAITPPLSQQSQAPNASLE